MFSERYLALIRTIADRRVLTTGMLADLEFGSSQAARRAVRAMVQHALVQVGSDRLGRRQGRPEKLISLSPVAVNALKASGALPRDTDLADVQAFALEDILDHQLMLNWVYVAVRRLLMDSTDFDATFVASTSPFRATLPGALAGLNMHIPDADGQDGKATLRPDAILVLTHRPSSRSLLFFVEVDMSTEPRVSPSGKPNDIRMKLVKYRTALARRLYKSCEQITGTTFNGFRVLFVANTQARSAEICRLVEEMAPMDFVWVTDHGRLQNAGLGGPIWHRGGRRDVPPQSILGTLVHQTSVSAREMGTTTTGNHAANVKS
jgi:hypothetical protein